MVKDQLGGDKLFQYYFQGLVLGLAYVAPIGMQNLYVINIAVRGNKLKAFQVALVTIFFDITLALACFFGIGLLIENVPVLEKIILLLGSVLVIFIGISLLRSSTEVSADLQQLPSLLKIVTTSFLVTWINPQAVIDGSLLLGGYYASIPPGFTAFFIAGFSSASIVWFLSLAAITLKLGNRINNQVARIINIAAGSIIIFFGIKLGLAFLNLQIK